MNKSPTKLSLERLRKDGWTVAITERWNPFAKIRQDLFNFVDVLAMCDQRGFLAVQTTDYTSISKRIKKIATIPAAATFLAAGGKIEVHGWSKVGGKYVCKVTKYPVAKNL